MYDHSSKAFFNFDATWFRLKTEPVVQRWADLPSREDFADRKKRVQFIEGMKEAVE